MSHQVFVPVTDEIIYNHPEQIEGPLVPYAAGMECHEWLSIEINPEESIDQLIKRTKADRKLTKVDRKKSYGFRSTSKLRLAYSS